ncbi:MAG: hypothetical protein EBZ48_05915 [Proteobacteria bacterium]|nr:hypothetical protein [Pseudomonadota bacterium]
MIVLLLGGAIATAIVVTQAPRSRAVLAQEQSLFPTPAPTVSWLLDDTQTFINPHGRIAPAELRRDSNAPRAAASRRSPIIDEISRFALSVDDRKRPIIHYRFSRGIERPVSSSDAP